MGRPRSASLAALLLGSVVAMSCFAIQLCSLISFFAYFIYKNLIAMASIAMASKRI